MSNKNNKKLNLLKNLAQDTYCRLGCSNIHGVGVIAIKDIPKNTDPFKFTSINNSKYIDISKKDLEKLDKSVIKLVTDFIQPVTSTYSVPYNGMNSLDITFYLNHSTSANLDIVNDNKSNYFVFRTNRKIDKGEELTINYENYNL